MNKQTLKIIIYKTSPRASVYIDLCQRRCAMNNFGMRSSYARFPHGNFRGKTPEKLAGNLPKTTAHNPKTKIKNRNQTAGKRGRNGPLVGETAKRDKAPIPSLRNGHFVIVVMFICVDVSLFVCMCTSRVYTPV